MGTKIKTVSSTLLLLFGVLVWVPNPTYAATYTLVPDKSQITILDSNPVILKINVVGTIAPISRTDIYLNYYQDKMTNRGFTARNLGFDGQTYSIEIVALPLGDNGDYELTISTPRSSAYEDQITIKISINLPLVPTKLVASTTGVEITSNEPTEFTVNIVGDMRRVKEVIVASTSDDLKNERIELKSGGLQSGQADFRFTIVPVSNGIEHIVISGGEGIGGVEFDVHVNVSEFDQYTEQIEISCDIPAYGKTASCILESTLEGFGISHAPTTHNVKILYGLSSKSMPWKTFSTVKLTPGKSVRFRTPVIKATTNISFQPDEPYAGYFDIAKVKPYAPFQVSIPRVANVGATFTLTARTISNYSGNCYAGSTKFKVVKGYGSVKVYGDRPGNLTITVSCRASGWEESGRQVFMYIRG